MSLVISSNALFLLSPLRTEFKSFVFSLMQHPAEHKSPQFAVGAEFNSLTNLKHACKRAAILDIFEFVPEKVSKESSTIEHADTGSISLLHPSLKSFPTRPFVIIESTSNNSPALAQSGSLPVILAAMRWRYCSINKRIHSCM